MATEIELIEHGLGDGDHHIENLGKFISRLTAIMDSIPSDKRESAHIDVWCSGDYARAYADVIVP